MLLSNYYRYYYQILTSIYLANSVPNTVVNILHRLPWLVVLSHLKDPPLHSFFVGVAFKTLLVLSLITLQWLWPQILSHSQMCSFLIQYILNLFNVICPLSPVLVALQYELNGDFIQGNSIQVSMKKIFLLPPRQFLPPL